MLDGTQQFSCGSEKGRLQGRPSIQSTAAALRAFMRQRWYMNIQAYVVCLFVCLFVEFGNYIHSTDKLICHCIYDIYDGSFISVYVVYLVY